MGVRGRHLGPPDEAGVSRGGVQAGEPPDIGLLRGREHALGPADGLEELDGEPHQGSVGGEVSGRLHLTAVEAPPVRRPQVRQLRLHPADVGPPLRAVPALPPPDGLAREVRRVSVARPHARIRLRQPLVRERPDGLEQAVPGPCGAEVCDDERLAHQRVQHPQHLDVVARLGDGAQGRQVEATREHRGPTQDRALFVVEEVVGPGHRVPQRRLTVRPQLWSGQQPEPVAEPVSHLDRAHGRHPRRGQLDPEGEPVERRADVDHGVRSLLVEDPEPGPYRTSPLDEQGHRVGRHAVDGQRRHAQQCLARRAQVLARGREDAWDVGASQDLTDRLRGRREHVLAVVDHDQHATSGECLGHRVDDARTALRR